ncbi:glutaredoxin domain-containing cysteine-rich protein CG12206-like [Diabrotica undecimpunctata]|uniref:glutaredoxin domain-containing cysteine-rich protein CG12206-like n=1 Tax=Diabrotica undecimpunctata TaxID=50387 RepID=UPI003B641E4A
MSKTLVPPLLPKTKPHLLQESASTTVLPNGTAAVSLVDVFSTHKESNNHVVKILISPQNDNSSKTFVNYNNEGSTEVISDTAPCIRINLGAEPDVVQKSDMSRNYFYYREYNYGAMSSGQISPSETMDSGTCSDLDGTSPPVAMKSKNGVSVTLIGSHNRAPSSSSGAEVDSDDNESSVSCDSLNCGKISPINIPSTKSALLPPSLLEDIRQRLPKTPTVEENPYENSDSKNDELDSIISTDMFYKFHINENVNSLVPKIDNVIENETFAGYKDILDDGCTTIKSAKGTVRGVKNRVRAGIATFLQINSTGKNYKEKELGKVVVYTTTMGILRETYQACMKVKQILRLLLVKFEERDVFMSSEYQAEIQERMRCDQILVPQVFVDGVHMGDAETIERLNETGELRRILKPFKSFDVCTTCKVCGGYRLLPCQICKGSKKSVHRNHFTAEFVALKCMNCDEVGLVKCRSCS